MLPQLSNLPSPQAVVPSLEKPKLTILVASNRSLSGTSYTKGLLSYEKRYLVKDITTLQIHGPYLRKLLRFMLKVGNPVV